MTQEEKQLLLRDLCARLPYMVKVITPWKKDGPGILTLVDITSNRQVRVFEDWYKVEEIKPYLRPISSMTEEEWEEFEKEFGISLGAGANSTSFNVYDYIVIDFGYHYDMYMSEMFKMLNWFYSRHYDINNLIKKGLAIEAPKDMY